VYGERISVVMIGVWSDGMFLIIGYGEMICVVMIGVWCVYKFRDDRGIVRV